MPRPIALLFVVAAIVAACGDDGPVSTDEIREGLVDEGVPAELAECTAEKVDGEISREDIDSNDPDAQDRVAMALNDCTQDAEREESDASEPTVSVVPDDEVPSTTG